MTNKDDLQKQINDIQAQINKLKEPELKYGFEDGDTFYFLHSNGGITKSLFYNDHGFAKMGNAYHTREEAERARDRQILIAELKAELDGDKCDWGDEGQKKYCLYYSYRRKEWDWGVRMLCKTPLTLYSTKARPDIIEKYGDRLNLLLED